MVNLPMEAHPVNGGGMDRAFRVAVPASAAEIVGAVLMDLLGPFELQEFGGDEAGQTVVLVFYPDPGVAPSPSDLLAALPPQLREGDPDLFSIEARDVPRDWVEGWRDHFRPIVVGTVRIRPPWEPAEAGPVDLVINPGLGFGTGLHPTTRGALQLLQEGAAARVRSSRGPLVDAGTGSGVLAIAAAKLGWTPVLAFDNDPVALVSARDNIEVNGVQDTVEVHEMDVADASLSSLCGATVVANMTLEPVSVLLLRLGAEVIPPEQCLAAPAGAGATAAGATAVAPAASAASKDLPTRMVVSGILAGAQGQELLRPARASGFIPGRRIYEGEWVSLELLPAPAAAGRPAAREDDLPTGAGGG
jgi:ribosomal protein L11 methylase PrmA